MFPKVRGRALRVFEEGTATVAFDVDPASGGPAGPSQLPTVRLRGYPGTMLASPGSTTSSRARPILLLVTALYVTVLVRNAWMTDDAYITLRTVDNFVAGRGLTWNVGERVQAFTHPLWLLGVAAVYAFTHEAYFSTLALSMAVSVAAVVVLARGVAASTGAFLLGATLLVVSKAHVDYCTSGLENPLVHLLLMLFAASLLGRWADERSVPRCALMAGLCVLARPDTLLLVLPGAAVALASLPRGRAWRSALAALALPAAWAIFSLWYYGSVLPNTAHAKLDTGIPRAELARQGFQYFADSLRVDPVTLLVVAFACAMAGWRRRRRDVAVAAGILAYAAYVLGVGGDFMSGRFFSAPHALAVAWIAARFAPSRRTVTVLASALLAAACWSSRSSLRAGEDYGSRPRHLAIAHGIADERAQYYATTGLLLARHQRIWPHTEGMREGRRLREEGVLFVLSPNIGFLGFAAGPSVHVLDPYGLADPLLARLPISASHVDPITHTRWRIGHFARDIPRGYPETLRSGENHIVDASLARYYDQLCVLTRGDLWSRQRLVEIVRFELGRAELLRAKYLEAYPGP